MILLAIVVLLLGAALCMGLTRLVPTRWIGVGAAVLALLVVLILLAQPEAGSTTPLDQLADRLAVRLDAERRGLAVLMLLGSSAALSVLALVLSPSLRGFGILFGWALLTLAAALLGLAGAGLRLPFAWGLTAMLASFTVRATGTAGNTERVPVGAAAGVIASLLLLSYLLLFPAATPVAGIQSTLLMTLLVLATLLLMGSAPFLFTRTTLATAPAALVGMIGGVVLPVLALGTLTHLLENLRLALPAPQLPLAWRLVLIILGLMAVVGGSAGATGERMLKRMVLWLMVVQAGVVVLALGLEHPLETLTVLLLLTNLVLTTLAAALAAASVEQQTGSDDVTRVQPDPPYLPGDLRLAGVLWAIAAASVLGVPGLLGFWGRSWLIAMLVGQVPWAIPLLIFSGVLLAVACMLPLIRMFALNPTYTPASSQAIPLAPVLLVLLPLPLLGLFPDLLWQVWLAPLPGMPAQLPITRPAQFGSVAGVIGLVVVLLHIWQPLVSRRLLRDPDMPPAILAPDGLPRHLGGLAGLAAPQALAGLLWTLLQRLGQAARQMLLLFEGKYYLVGVLFALISALLLMAQGGRP